MSDAAAERIEAWLNGSPGDWLDFKPADDLRALLSERAVLRAENTVLREALQDIATMRPPNGWKAGDIARAALSGSTE